VLISSGPEVKSCRARPHSEGTGKTLLPERAGESRPRGSPNYRRELSAIPKMSLDVTLPASCLRYTQDQVRQIEGAAEPATRPIAPNAPPAKPEKTATELAREKMLAEINSCRLSVSEKIEEPLPRLYLADKVVATEDNLVAIVAKAGTGKSAIVGAGYAAPVAAALGIGAEADCLGFTADNINKQAVVVVDTEQSRYDAQLCIKRALRRADTEEAPAWLETFSLVGKARSWRRKALRPILEAASDAHEGIFAVFLDGVADLITNVNDIDECIEVVAELRTLSIDFHCPIVCVIHSNEGEASGDKARGWIGSELIREAQTVILLKKDAEATVVTTYKQRKAPVTKDDGVAFKWSDAEQRMASCGSPAQAKLQAKNDALRALAAKCFGSATTMARGVLEEAVGINGNVRGDTRRVRVNEMLAKVIIHKRADGLYTLVRTN
jgi:hypothetical protein